MLMGTPVFPGRMPGQDGVLRGKLSVPSQRAYEGRTGTAVYARDGASGSGSLTANEVSLEKPLPRLVLLSSLIEGVMASHSSALPGVST